MKKLLALVLAMVMVLSFAACGNNEEPSEENNAETVEVGSALEILETVWGQFGEDEKFFSMGGDYDNMVDSAPGTVTNADFISGVLYVPAEEAANISECASLVHGMNLNNFTCAAYKVSDAAAFAEAMKASIAGVQWICGMPEKLVIATLGSEYAVVMFGVNDAVNPFEEKFVAAYPAAEIVTSEAIVG